MEAELGFRLSPRFRIAGIHARSEPVSTWSRTNDTSRFSALLTLRYDLR